MKNVFSRNYEEDLKTFALCFSPILLGVDNFCASNLRTNEDISNFVISKTKNNDLMQTIRSNHRFIELVDLAENDTVEILHFLSKKIKDFSNEENYAAVLDQHTKGLKNYDKKNEIHRKIIAAFFTQFSNLLILSITAKYKPRDASHFIARIGYKLATTKFFSAAFCNEFINVFMLIFSLFSETDFIFASQIFMLFSESAEIEKAFLLLQYVRLDYDPDMGVNFMTLILSSLKNLRTKKLLTPVELQCTSNMLLSLPYNKNIQQDFLDFAQTLVGDKVLNAAAVLLISTIYVDACEPFSKYYSFFKASVVPLLDKKNSVYALLSLRNFMVGKGVDLKALIFKDSISFIKSNTQKGIATADPKSFASIFTSTFFNVLDYEQNVELIVNILIHIAALDFQNFTTSILPLFVKSDPKSPKMLVFLTAVPFINSPDFMKYAGKTAPKMYIDEFNRLVKASIVNELPSIASECNQTTCIGESMLQHIRERTYKADTKVDELVDEWHLQNPVNKVVYRWRTAETVNNNFHVLRIYLECIRHVFSVNDFKNPELINIMLSLLTSSDYICMKTVFNLCTDVYSNEQFAHSMIKELTKALTQPEPDPHKVLMKIIVLERILEKTIKTLSKEEIEKIKLICIIWLGSVHPEIRILLTRIHFIFMINDITFLGSNDLSDFNSFEQKVKKRLSLFQEKNSADVPPSLDGSLPIIVAIACHYPLISLLYVAELTTLLPMFSDDLKKELDLILPAFISTLTSSPTFGNFMDVFIIITFFNVHVNKEDAKQEDFRPAALSLLISLLSHKHEWCAKAVFIAMPLCNSFYFPSFFSIFLNVKKEYIPSALDSMIGILFNDDIEFNSFRSSLGKIANFVAALHSFLIAQGINNPRLINWDDASELLVQKNKRLVLQFCQLINQIFEMMHHISPDEWPISNRQITFRFLVNWSYTKSESLALIRGAANLAIRSLLLNGRVFTDPLFFDESTINLLAKNKLLFCANEILEHHVDILLASFIDNCFLQPAEISRIFLQAIIEVIKEENIDYFYLECYSIILFGLSLSQHSKKESDLLFSKLFALYRKFPEKEGLEGLVDNIEIDQLPKHFSFAAEAIFFAAFHYMNQPNCHITVQSIVNAISPFIKCLRLLPKQRHCLQDVIEVFSFFTPYQFLGELMRVTASTNQDDFNWIIILWKELMKSPDHSDIVLIYILQNNRYKEVVYKLAKEFFQQQNKKFVEMVVNRISFAAVFDAEHNSKKVYPCNDWIINLICDNIYNDNMHILDEYLPDILHYAFILNSKEEYSLLDSCCKKFGISPKQKLSNNDLVQMTKKFISKISDDQKKQWGIVATKYFLGMKDIRKASLSLAIFNQLMTPVDNLTINGVCKTVIYHLNNSSNDINQLCQLIGSAVEFFAANFEGNEKFCFSFLSSFLDCNIFFETIYKFGFPLVSKIITSEVTSTEAWAQLVKLIKPTLIYSPCDPKAMQIIDELSSSSDNPELLLAIAPVRKVYQGILSEAQQPTRELIYTVQQNALNNVLEHYSLMLPNAKDDVFDSILAISTNIIGRIKKPEQCIQSLAKIYQFALSSIESQSSFSFIRTIAKVVPNIASQRINTYMEWSKSTNDIVRELSHLIVGTVPTQVLTVTDCKTVSSVYNILNADVIPRIIPFSTQREMIEGMIAVAKLFQKRKLSVRRTETNREALKLARKKSSYKRRESNMIALDLISSPLDHPKHINPQAKENESSSPSSQLIPSIEEFLNN